MAAFDMDIMLDCGAPSLYNRLSKKEKSSVVMGATFKDRKFDDFSYTEQPEYKRYRNAYIEFLLLNGKSIEHYTNLDVINNPSLTWRNQQVLERAGLHPIPVYHIGSKMPEKHLRRYVERYDYIALGGLIPNKTDVIKEHLDYLFNEYILDKDGFPKVKVHGFACTSPWLMWRYPWFSVDSTTARKLAMYGHVYLPTINDNLSVKTVTISSRHVSQLNKPIGLISNRKLKTVPKSEQPTLLDGTKKRVIAQAEKIGCTWENLCGNYMERMLYNHIYFSHLVHTEVPLWPWSFKTRKSKKGADELFNLYIAGCFSKSEEAWFWQELSQRPGTEKALKKRLHSFFYANQVKYLIKLKEGEKE
jgi:hypothetical protein